MKTCNFCGKSLNEAQYVYINGVIYKSCPDCSKKNNNKEHIYYSLDAFGTTIKRITKNNPIGIQSHCSKCRSNRTGPHDNALLCSTIDNNKAYIINECRILPMSKSVFESYDKVKDFITNILPNRNGLYYYMNSHMNCPNNTLVFFQYNAKLIGYAILIDKVELENSVNLSDGNEYNGYYQFSTNSITLFNEPITKEQYASIDSSFKTFGQASQIINILLLPAIFKVVNEVSGYIKPIISNDISLQKIENKINEDSFEGNTKERAILLKERNQKIVKSVKERDKYTCRACGFSYGNKIVEAHHLIPMSDKNEEYKVNIDDLITLCPTCHSLAHLLLNKDEKYTDKELLIYDIQKILKLKRR